MYPTPGLPTIYPGMIVEVSDDETFARVHIGQIVADNNGRPHIIACRIIDEDNVEPIWTYGNCVHQSDPDLPSLKDDIRQNEHRGVYRLAMSELRSIEMEKSITRLERLIAEKTDASNLQSEIADDLRQRVELLEEVAAKTGAIRPVKQRA